MTFCFTARIDYFWWRINFFNIPTRFQCLICWITGCQHFLRLKRKMLQLLINNWKSIILIFKSSASYLQNYCMMSLQTCFCHLWGFLFHQGSNPLYQRMSLCAAYLKLVRVSQQSKLHASEILYKYLSIRHQIVNNISCNKPLYFLFSYLISFCPKLTRLKDFLRTKVDFSVCSSSNSRTCWWKNGFKI